ncbi:TPA: polysaccharide biosynthesis protein [Candidatus Poribacteria bacterium]|nr:polysaccharide biosynthesis protein [Candidatus Poribacteria bacterium]
MKIELISNYLKDPLIRNSFFLMMSSLLFSAFGFVSWVLAARLYRVDEIGIATALISSIALLVLISRMGLDYSVIRFFKDKDSGALFGTSCFLTTFVALILGIFFIFGIDIFSPQLSIIKEYAIFYIIFLLMNSITTIIGTFFIAMRRTKYHFFQSILINLKIIFLIPLINLGSLGIFFSYGIGYVIALIVSMIILIRHINFPSIKWEILDDSFYFSLGNFIATFFMTCPNMIIPIITLNLLGAEATAYYYIAYAIASMLFVIPNAFGISLFVEGSYNRNLREIVVKSLGSFIILIPSVAIIALFGSNILSLIGEDYSVSVDLLILLALSSFFIVICNIYCSILRIKNRMHDLMLFNGLIFFLLIVLCYVLSDSMGLIGIGYSWVISYGIASFLILAKGYFTYRK